MGITGSLWKWFRAYLSNRWNYVDYEGYSSTKLAVRAATEASRNFRAVIAYG